MTYLDDIFGDGNPHKDLDAERQRFFEETGIRSVVAVPRTSENITFESLKTGRSHSVRARLR
jgi:hypothetical protein